MKWFAILGTITFAVLSVAQLTASQVVGDWEGESKCVNLEAAPACRDEHVIFHITRVRDKQNKVIDGSVFVRADKVVDKKNLTMGYLTFKVDLSTYSIQNVFKNKKGGGVWNLSIKNNQMTGTLTQLPGNVVVRKLTLARKKN
jgi:hypothetical protein